MNKYKLLIFLGILILSAFADKASCEAGCNQRLNDESPQCAVKAIAAQNACGFASHCATIYNSTLQSCQNTLSSNWSKCLEGCPDE